MFKKMETMDLKRPEKLTNGFDGLTPAVYDEQGIHMDTEPIYAVSACE